MRSRDPDYRCLSPRAQRYDNPKELQTDLRGHWLLTDPQGRACEVVIGSGVSLTSGCIALGEPVANIREEGISGHSLQLLGRGDVALLSFDTSNLDDLHGIEVSQGYRLVRLEAQAISPRGFEGAWQLRNEGFACDIFLVMRSHIVGPHPFADAVHVPHGLSLAANCVDPKDAGRLRISHLDGARPPLSIPVWTHWRSDGHQILLIDGENRVRRFAHNGDVIWTAEVMQPGHPPVRLKLTPVGR